MKSNKIYFLSSFVLLFLFSCNKKYEVLNIAEVEPVDSIATSAPSKYPITLFVENNNITYRTKNSGYRSWHSSVSRDSIIFYSKDSVWYNACKVSLNNDGVYTGFLGKIAWDAMDYRALGGATFPLNGFGQTLIISREDNSIFYRRRFDAYNIPDDENEVKIEAKVLNLELIE